MAPETSSRTAAFPSSSQSPVDVDFSHASTHLSGVSMMAPPPSSSPPLGPGSTSALPSGAPSASGVPLPSKKDALSERMKNLLNPERPFACMEPGCGKRFNRRFTLSEHMKTHTGARPYGCSEPGCGKRFSTSGNLARHKRMHTGAKPFCCPVESCGKKFATNGKLSRHMQTHTGARPFRCAVQDCGKKFSTQGNLTRHMKVHGIFAACKPGGAAAAAGSGTASGGVMHGLQGSVVGARGHVGGGQAPPTLPHPHNRHALAQQLPLQAWELMQKQGLAAKLFLHHMSGGGPHKAAMPSLKANDGSALGGGGSNSHDKVSVAAAAAVALQQYPFLASLGHPALGAGMSPGGFAAPSAAKAAAPVLPASAKDTSSLAQMKQLFPSGYGMMNPLALLSSMPMMDTMGKLQGFSPRRITPFPAVGQHNVLGRASSSSSASAFSSSSTSAAASNSSSAPAAGRNGASSASSGTPGSDSTAFPGLPDLDPLPFGNPGAKRASKTQQEDHSGQNNVGKANSEGQGARTVASAEPSHGNKRDKMHRRNLTLDTNIANNAASMLPPTSASSSLLGKRKAAGDCQSRPKSRSEESGGSKALEKSSLSHSKRQRNSPKGLLTIDSSSLGSCYLLSPASLRAHFGSSSSFSSSSSSASSSSSSSSSSLASSSASSSAASILASISPRFACGLPSPSCSFLSPAASPSSFPFGPLDTQSESLLGNVDLLISPSGAMDIFNVFSPLRSDKFKFPPTPSFSSAGSRSSSAGSSGSGSTSPPSASSSPVNTSGSNTISAELPSPSLDFAHFSSALLGASGLSLGLSPARTPTKPSPSPSGTLSLENLGTEEGVDGQSNAKEGDVQLKLPSGKKNYSSLLPLTLDAQSVINSLNTTTKPTIGA